MSASFQREEELFASVLALPVVERPSYLERACGGDLELLVRMQELLAGFSEAERRMESAPWLNTLQKPKAEEKAGDQIGNYQLIEVIGEGGGGTVYRAEQSAPVRREVALKIIKPGSDSRAVISRFEAERRLLAMMGHPNIAQVFEAGVTHLGRPYYAMELVHGARITVYCDQARLSPEERLQLFVQTCYAIQHAHQKGVVHRDIKPSNVLVTLHDGLPLVKVIDFGIAKATGVQLDGESVHTALGQFVGTPAYVSPEQVEYSSDDIDGRSDIYSLGVLLYELLTGFTPFDSAELLAGGFARMASRIRDEEPPSPSRRLRILDRQSMTVTAERRRMRASQLVRFLHGDLDWIVMRCLEKDRARRYATVGDLVADVQRYLRHEPVVARPRRIFYVLTKFARRHRAVFATSVIIGGVLLAATLVSSWLAVRAMQAEKLAQAEAASRQEIISFLQQDLLMQSSPTEEPDRDLKLRTVLDRTSAKIKDRFPGRPLIEADVRETLARTYDSLGEYKNARAHIEAAFDIRRRELGEEHPKTLALLGYLADLLVVEGEYQRGEALSHKVIAAQRRVLGPENEETLRSVINLASAYQQEGRFDQAAQLLEQTLPVLKRVLGPEAEETLTTMNNLALAYRNQGKFDAAAALHEQEYAISLRVLGPEHPDTQTSMNNLGVAYSDAGRFAEAAALGQKTLDLSARIMGATHPETLILASNQSKRLLDLGDYAGAERMALRVIAGSQGTAQVNPQNLIKAQNALAMTHRAQGRLDEARQLQQQTVDSAVAVLGAEHPTSVVLLSNLALIDEDQGKLSEADALMQLVMTRGTVAFGAEHPQMLRFMDQQAGLLLKLGRYDRARELLQASLAARKDPAVDWRTFSARSRLGEALLGLGKRDEGARLLIDADAGLQRLKNTIPANEQALTDSKRRLQQLSAAQKD